MQLNSGYTRLNNLAQPETAWNYYLINSSWDGYDILYGFTATDRDQFIVNINASN